MLIKPCCTGRTETMPDLRAPDVSCSCNYVAMTTRQKKRVLLMLPYKVSYSDLYYSSRAAASALLRLRWLVTNKLAAVGLLCTVPQGKYVREAQRRQPRLRWNTV